jgi:nitrogenase subunit NifH
MEAMSRRWMDWQHMVDNCVQAGGRQGGAGCGGDIEGEAAISLEELNACLNAMGCSLPS